MAKSRVGDEDKYMVLGVDWSEKKMGIPVYGWAAGLAVAAYYFLRKGRRR